MKHIVLTTEMRVKVSERICYDFKLRKNYMHLLTFRDSLHAYFLRLLPGPFGRYRRRYAFYLKIKNSNLLLRRRIRHSGIVLPLNLGEWVQYWMFMDGAYEKQLVDFLKPIVKGKTFFDVGANIGAYTLTLAKSAARTYSFEASASNANILRNFIGLSKLSSIEVINKAVSNKSGESVSIYSSPDTGGNNTQFHDFGKGCETISTITLDQFVADNNIDLVDVIKIDIEGAELAAFQGAHNLLSKCRPVLLVEFNALAAKQANWRLVELYNLLKNYDYNVFELSRKGLISFEPSRLSSPEFYANLIFQ